MDVRRHRLDPARDIAGIILNGRGHARVIQTPGFYYGRDGRTAPREVVEDGYGRIGVAHSEPNGSQNATGAVQRRTAAVERALELLG